MAKGRKGFFQRAGEALNNYKDRSNERKIKVINAVSDAVSKMKLAQAEKIRAKSERDMGRTSEYYKTKRTKARWRRATQMVGSIAASAAAQAKSNADAYAKANSSVNVWNSIINGDNQQNKDDTTSTSQIAGGENIRA